MRRLKELWTRFKKWIITILAVLFIGSAAVIIVPNYLSGVHAGTPPVINLTFNNGDYTDSGSAGMNWTGHGAVSIATGDACKYFDCLNLSATSGDYLSSTVNWNSTCMAVSFWVSHDRTDFSSSSMFYWDQGTKDVTAYRFTQNGGYSYSTGMSAATGEVNHNVGSSYFAAGVWQHVFIQYNNETQRLITWVNGVVEENTSEPYGNLNNTYGLPMQIGRGAYGIDLEGYLDEFKMWNVCDFTQADVEADYALYALGTPPDLDVYVQNVTYDLPRNWTDDGGHNEPILGQEFQINTTIKNEGINDTGSFHYTIAWDNGTTIVSTSTSLDAGASETINFNVSIPTYLWRKIYVRLDDTNALTDDVPENNNYTINVPYMDNFWTLGHNRTTMAEAIAYCASSGDLAEARCDWYKGFLSSNFSTSYTGNSVDPYGKKYLEDATSCMLNGYVDPNPAKPQCQYAVANMWGWANLDPSTYDNVQSIHELLWVEQANDIMMRNVSKAEFQELMAKYQAICQAVSTLPNTRPDINPGTDETAISGGNGWGFGSGIGSMCDFTTGNVASNANNNLIIDDQYWTMSAPEGWQNRIRSFLRAYGNHSEANYQEGWNYKWYSQTKIVPIIVGLNKAGIEGFDQFNNAYCSMAKESIYSLLDNKYNGATLFGDENRDFRGISRGDSNSYEDIGSDTIQSWDILTYFGLLCPDQQVKDAIMYLRTYAYDQGDGKAELPAPFNYYLLVAETTMPSNIENFTKYFYDEQNDIATWRNAYTYTNDSVIQIDGGQHKMSGHPHAQGRYHYYAGYEFLSYDQVPYNDNTRTEVWSNGVSFSNSTGTEGYIEGCGEAVFNQYYGDNQCDVIGTYPNITYLPLNMSGDIYGEWGSDDGLNGGLLNTIPVSGSSEPIKEHFLIINGNVVRYVVVPHSDTGHIYDQVLNRDTEIDVNSSDDSSVLFQAFDSNTFLNFSVVWSNETGTMHETNTSIRYGFTKTNTPTGKGFYRRSYFQIDQPSAEYITTETGYTTSAPTTTTIASGNDRGVNISGQAAVFDTAGDGISYDGFTTDAWGLIILNDTHIAVQNATYVNNGTANITLPSTPYSGIIAASGTGETPSGPCDHTSFLQKGLDLLCTVFGCKFETMDCYFNATRTGVADVKTPA